VASARSVSRGSIGRSGSSTVFQPPYAEQATKPTLVTRGLIAVRKIFFTAKDLSNPDRLYQVLSQMQAASTAALQALSSSPMSVCVLLQNVSFTASQVQYLNHGLGHAYAGWFPVRSITANLWTGTEWLLPAGVSSSLVLPLKAGSAGGTFSFVVF
jgi:hypothetical protein